MSALATFLEGLLLEGTVMVRPGPEVPGSDLGCAKLLRKACQDDAWHFPGPAPRFDESAALKGATWFYSAAMCYADRSMTVDASARLLAAPLFQRLDDATVYSVDLVLRHLPALHELASGLADGDPVLTSLKRMAWLWPLSSVGVPLPTDWSQPDLTLVRSHAGLWRLYLDRVLAASDLASLKDPDTQAAARRSLGLHPQLAPRLLPHWPPSPASPQALS